MIKPTLRLQHRRVRAGNDAIRKQEPAVRKNPTCLKRCPMSKKIAFRINTIGEYSGDSPDGAVVEITPELAARIRQLKKAVRDLDVLHIQEFNSCPEYYCGEDFEEKTLSGSTSMGMSQI